MATKRASRKKKLPKKLAESVIPSLSPISDSKYQSIIANNYGHVILLPQNGAEFTAERKINLIQCRPKNWKQKFLILWLILI